mmetsp:Transcript_1140/g.2800  ORF Transcript_1140/g.2800 Transcript_1140/m.2800 type:complete len:203 (-) Transcript_1140:136-744(-)
MRSICPGDVILSGKLTGFATRSVPRSLGSFWSSMSWRRTVSERSGVTGASANGEKACPVISTEMSVLAFGIGELGAEIEGVPRNSWNEGMLRPDGPANIVIILALPDGAWREEVECTGESWLMECAGESWLVYVRFLPAQCRCASACDLSMTSCICGTSASSSALMARMWLQSRPGTGGCRSAFRSNASDTCALGSSAWFHS